MRTINMGRITDISEHLSAGGRLAPVTSDRRWFNTGTTVIPRWPEDNIEDLEQDQVRNVDRYELFVA